MVASSSAPAAKRAKRTGASPSSNLPVPLEQRTLLFCLALIAVVVVAYSPVIHNEFIYDDYKYIAENPHVKAGLTWATVEWAFTTYDEANWHPLTWLSHALDRELFGLNPAGPHCMNVLLHAVNAVLLFLLLKSATGFRWRSLMVAALFALHPINVESVAWAAERKNVLSMMFFLLALYAYVWYVRVPGVRRYAAVACLFALSLLAKPQAITLPFLLLLLDYWPLGRFAAAAETAPSRHARKLSGGSLVLEKVPLLLLSAASAVVTMEAQNKAIETFSQCPLLLRVENAAISYVRYLGKALWPAKLVALYPHPTKLYPIWQIGAAVMLLLLISGLVVHARERRYLAVGWLWFLGSLVPMIGLVQVGSQAMADRYAYIPFIGLFLIVVWLVADWANARRVSARWLAISAVACLLALGTLTYRQVGYWHDAESFWSRTVELTEGNYVAHGALARSLNRRGKTEEAAAHYRAALAIWPDDMPANLNLGAYEYDRGNLPAAIERFEKVAQHAGHVGLRAKAYEDLGGAYRQMGQALKAKQYFEMSLQLVPDQPNILLILGVIAHKDGDLAEAVRLYSHAMAMQPSDVGYLLLAQALEQEGRADEANAILRRAARSSPNLAAARKRAEALLAGK